MSEFQSEFLPTDVRFSVSFKTKVLENIVTRQSDISTDDLMHPGSELIQITAKDSHDGAVAHVRLKTFNGFSSMMSVTDKVLVRRDGEIYVPTKNLSSVLKLVKGSDVSLVCVGFELQVSSENSLWRIKLPSRAKGGQIEIQSESQVTVNANDLFEALSSVIKASARGLARVSLTQVRVKDGDIVACDGQRFHKYHLEALQAIPEFTIPEAGVHLMLKALKTLASTDNVQLRVSSSTVSLVSARDVVTVLRNKLEYPDVEKVFVSQAVLNDTTISVDTNELLEAVKTVKLFADSLLNSVHIMSESDNSILVQSEDEVGNSSQVRLKSNIIGKSRVDLHLNYKNLIDVLSSMTSDIVQLSAATNSKTNKSSALFQDTVSGFMGILSQTIKEK